MSGEKVNNFQDIIWISLTKETIQSCKNAYLSRVVLRGKKVRNKAIKLADYFDEVENMGQLIQACCEIMEDFTSFPGVRFDNDYYNIFRYVVRDAIIKALKKAIESSEFKDSIKENITPEYLIKDFKILAEVEMSSPRSVG